MTSEIATVFDHDVVVDRKRIADGGLCIRTRPVFTWRGAVRGIGGDLAVVEVGQTFLLVCRQTGESRFRCQWPLEIGEPDLPTEARHAMRDHLTSRSQRSVRSST